jgi:hypothetical protein
MALLANDLENYYYLYHGRAVLEEVAEAFQQEVLHSLPDLYFGDEDPGRGIYGDVGRMLTFYKSNIEPFPAFAVPCPLLPELLGKVNEKLRQLVGDSGTNINIILAILSFFYARDGAEMQSFSRLSSSSHERRLAAGRCHARRLCLGPGRRFRQGRFHRTEERPGD